jgi:hypothetical protein
LQASASAKRTSGWGGSNQLKNQTAHIPRSLFAIVLVLLAMLVTAALVSAVARRSYYQLAVIVNDSQAPTVAFSFWLDSPYPYDPTNYSDTVAGTISITADFGPELAYEGVPGGVYNEVRHNVLSDTWFNITATETPQTATPVFTTVAVTVVYTDNFDQNPRTIYRSLTFALNYREPAASVNPFVAAAAGLGAAGVLGLGVYVTRRGRLEQLYLMHDSGMLIRTWSRKQGPVHDGDIMSGMFIVLQEFVRDSFDDRGGSLEQLRFGQRQVLMVRGEHSVLAAVIQGRYLSGIPRKLQVAVWEFERSHADVLAKWDGNVALLPQADAIAARFIRPRLRFHPN